MKNKQKVETLHKAYGKMFEQLKPVVRLPTAPLHKGYSKEVIKKRS
jgi:hypothetical protein